MGNKYVVLNGRNKEIVNVIFNGTEMVRTLVNLYNMKKDTRSAIVEHPARSGNTGAAESVFSTCMSVFVCNCLLLTCLKAMAPKTRKRPQEA